MESDVSTEQSQGPPPPIVPSSAPPLITPPPPPRPPRRGDGWLKVAIVLAILLAFSTLNQMRHLVHGLKARVTSGRQARQHLEEATVENDHSKSNVAVLDISGLSS